MRGRRELCDGSERGRFVFQLLLSPLSETCESYDHPPWNEYSISHSTVEHSGRSYLRI